MTEETVAKQKVVTFTYVILDENRSVQEQSDLPMSYLHGVDGKMFEKVEAELEGKTVGDVVEVTLEPAEAFGERDPSLTYSDSLENVPAEFQQIGAEATFQIAGTSRLRPVTGTSSPEIGSFSTKSRTPWTVGENPVANLRVMVLADTSATPANQA